MTPAEQPRWTWLDLPAWTGSLIPAENLPASRAVYFDGKAVMEAEVGMPLHDLIPSMCALLNAEGAVRELMAKANEAIRRASWFTCGHSWPGAFMSEADSAERSFAAYRKAAATLTAAMPPEEEKRDE